MAFEYRADNVGSFLRPQDLLDARDNPDVSSEKLKEIENRHILDVLERQKDLGLKIFTDGELRRGSFMGDFYDSVEWTAKNWPGWRPPSPKLVRMSSVSRSRM